MLNLALAFAAQGFPVFPVRGKRPLAPRGVYSATRDPDILRAFDWTGADGLGLATGAVSGVDVLDVDVRGSGGARPIGARTIVGRESSPPPSHDDVAGGVDGFAALAALGPLPETLIAATPGGGRHYYFQHVIGGRSRKLADGSVEWFGTGKLVVVPPAPGRRWLNRAEIAEAPDWLRGMVLAEHDGCRGGNSSGPLLSDGTANATGTINDSGRVPRAIYSLILRGMRCASGKSQRRVRGLWANLAAKRQHRNDGLNYTTWQFSEFVRGGDLDREIAAKLLWLACKANGYLAKDGSDVVKEVITRVLGLSEWPDVIGEQKQMEKV